MNSYFYLKSKNGQSIKCNTTHLLALSNESVAKRVAHLMRRGPKNNDLVSSYTTKPVMCRDEFGVIKNNLIQYGLCPDKLQALQASEVNIVIDKRECSYVDDSTDTLDIVSVHPYSLFSSTIFDHQPIIIGEVVIDDHPEMLCIRGICIHKE